MSDNFVIKGDEARPGIRIDVNQPVSKDVMLRIQEDLKSEIHHVGNHRSEYRGESLSRSKTAIMGLLKHLLAESWDDPSEGPHRFVAKSGNCGASTLRTVISVTRKALRLSCQALFPDLPAYVAIAATEEDGVYSVIWELPKAEDDLTDGAANVKRFAEVVILGKLLRTDFAVDFMRGAHAMAQQLGIELSDRRALKRTYEDLDSAWEIIATLNPTRHSIFLFFEAPTSTDGFARALSESGFTVVETGFNDERTIGVDNKALASTLIRCLIDDAAERTGIVLDLAFDGISSGSHGVVARSEVYKSALFASKKLTYEQIHVRGYVYDDEVGERVIEALADRLARPDANSVVAVTTKTEKSTIAVVDFLRAHRETWGHISCYSESLVFGVLNRLYDPISPLKAVCGIDFFHFGRYATRFCSTPRKWGQSVSKIPPLLITKADAATGHLFSTDRIPAYFKGIDVRLSGKGFA